MALLTEPNAFKKLKNIEDTCHRLLRGERLTVPRKIGRDVQVVGLRDLPPKKGLSYRDGQARLLHDLASIEMQAMELGVRTLIEFPDAPAEFRESLALISIEEAKHLRLCLETLDQMGFFFGSYPVHTSLWQSVDENDSLIDRILIVHRYLEGSGLDASDSLLKKLSSVPEAGIKNAIKVIAEDEVGHVQFGSDWYRKICVKEGIDPETDFRQRLFGLMDRIPRRIERINTELRKKVGFSDGEIAALNDLRGLWLIPLAERVPQDAKNASILPPNFQA
jgi:uncharacterized ferritin-like protein (DUF455 family)